MTFKRLWHSIRLCIIRGAKARTEYVKKKEIYAGIGENVEIMSRIIPLYSNLIKIHNNVQIASKVSFITHDVTHCMLNKMEIKGVTGEIYQEKIGCIEICDNVFIGTGVKILHNTKIGPNAIIAAGSIVTKDVPPNTVVGGVPARVICDFDTYLAKRESLVKYPNRIKPSNQEVSAELAQWAWDEFYASRKDKTQEDR